MISDIIIFIISLVILIFSSEIFTVNAVKLARSMGVSQFFIGTTIIGIGTSLPEILITDYASLKGECGIVLGNVLGSNVTNIALVLGLAIFLRSTVITNDNLLKDSIIHFLVLCTGCLFILSGNSVGRIEGMVLIGMYFLYIYYLLKTHTIERSDDNDIKNTFNIRIVLYTILGLVGVVGGSKLLVDSAVVIASELGIPNMVIGLTIIALGTSLPELAVSVSAAKRGFIMLIFGNIIGSNITNMNLATGTASVINKVTVDNINLINFNLLYLLLLSALLIIIVKKGVISSWWGGLYLLMYVFFIIFNL
ncbi:MAG: calcium/sodium antiporter [Methanosarcinales archaeon]|nr:calcium/sodium antiporter [Methanosarcinales archaeon]